MSDEKKIIIDEDWKSQVEAEKEALHKQPEETAEADKPAAYQLPPASLEMLVSTLATEAMVAMGQIPNPMTNERSVNLDHARYSIDLVDMLKQKTKGNLTDAEDTMFTELLHQLRMLFIAAQGAAPSGQG